MTFRIPLNVVSMGTDSPVSWDAAEERRALQELRSSWHRPVRIYERGNWIAQCTTKSGAIHVQVRSPFDLRIWSDWVPAEPGIIISTIQNLRMPLTLLVSDRPVHDPQIGLLVPKGSRRLRVSLEYLDFWLERMTPFELSVIRNIIVVPPTNLMQNTEAQYVPINSTDDLRSQFFGS